MIRSIPSYSRESLFIPDFATALTLNSGQGEKAPRHEDQVTLYTREGNSDIDSAFSYKIITDGTYVYCTINTPTYTHLVAVHCHDPSIPLCPVHFAEEFQFHEDEEEVD
jgi:hypothetical protein